VSRSGNTRLAVDPPAGGRNGAPRHAGYGTGIIASGAKGPRVIC
jgi:hypothetical protein